MQYFMFYFVCCWFFSAKFATSQNINNTTSSDATFTGNNLARPGCPSKCGNITIPFPFGIGKECSLNSFFDVNCLKNDGSSSDMIILGREDFHLIDILESTIRIRTDQFSERCLGEISERNLTLDFSTTPYSLSEANRLTVIGCSNMAILEGESKQNPSPKRASRNFASGCVSFCSDGDLSMKGSCPGNGCCQIPVPKGTVVVNASLSSLQGQLGKSDKCGYAFLGEQRTFPFDAISDLYKEPLTITDRVKTVPVILDWRIGNISCQEARISSSYACQENSDCIDAEAGVGGYRCRCIKGFNGNPYLNHGCVDIDECLSNTTCQSGWLCTNTPGSYICKPDQSSHKLENPVIGLIAGTSLLALLSVAVVFTKFFKKKKNQKRRQKFFKENGGLLLRQETSSNEGILRKTRIFTAKELEKATDYFNKSRILGQGGQGTVYKGMLSDGQIVAIKKSNLVNEKKSKHLVEQFINEVALLSLTSHRNVVKLLGCCLETRIPHLVYEFMPNGTLSDLIQGKNIEFPFTWVMRLKIAADVAGAVAYLHSATSIAIFHRDVKSSNILLDEKYISKLSDFGASKSVDAGRSHLTTLVSGTFGYIDPEYFQSSQFTEKSDVYSFGVILVELLTGLKPIMASTNMEDEKSLVCHFLSKMEGNNLESILESQVSGEGEKKDVMAVAKLAKRCLHLNGKQRPTMKQVAMELESLRKSPTGSVDYTTELAGDSARFFLPIFEIENSEYSWNTFDFGTASSSDVSPILHNTI